MPTRPVHKVSRDPQLALFDAPRTPCSHQPSQSTRRVFIQPDPDDIYLGNIGLRAHLEQSKLKAPFVVRTLLQEQDWQQFEHQYASQGRAPYAPVAMMGLILYGVHNGIHSLRGLERFARVDLGCMWVSGGIAPDHSVIGQFIARHGDLIANGLFECLTASVLKRTGSNSQQLAGDGTVIEAACSHYGLLHQEAVEAQYQVARDAVNKTPGDATKQARLDQAEHTAELMRARVENKQAQGKSTDNLRISSTEPEAMVQRQKRGRGSAPAYKPSILANEQRVVVAQAVDVSSETAVIVPMLDQSESVSGQSTQALLLDAGYCCDAVIEETLKRDINLLCPESQKPGQGKTSEKYYTKGCFDYDESTDSYRCPVGETLTVKSRYKGNDKAPAYTEYGTAACLDCAYKAGCTRSKKGRRIKRYAGDEHKEALRMVMGQAGAKALFCKRQAWVEPVFSVLRGAQGLNRFRRRGLTGVKIEFSLHILAYNLGRAIAFAALSLWRQWRRYCDAHWAIFLETYTVRMPAFNSDHCLHTLAIER